MKRNLYPTGSRISVKLFITTCQKYAHYTPFSNGIALRILERSKNPRTRVAIREIVWVVLALLINMEAFAVRTYTMFSMLRTRPKDGNQSFATHVEMGFSDESPERAQIE